MKNITETVIKYRWPIIIVFLAITAFFASQFPKIQMDSSLKSMLPDDLSSIVETDKIEDIFGGSDFLMVIMKSDDVLNSKTLKRIKNISKDFNRLKGVDKVLSLFDLKNIKGENGTMIVDPAVKRIPRSKKSREKLRKEIENNDMVYGVVVSKDFKYAAILVLVKEDISDDYLIESAEKIIKDNPGSEETFLGGNPFIRVRLIQDMQGDMKKLFPFGILIMLIFLFVSFKQLRGVLLPFLVVIMSIIFGMGLIPLLGWKVYMPTVILPVILIAIANNYGIHLVSKYQEDNYPGNNYTKEELAKRGLKSLSKPVIVAGITTMAGFFSLLTHVSVPAKQLGFLSGVSIVFALAASLLFIPAVLSLLPKAKPIVDVNSADMKKKPFLDKALNYFSNIVIKQPKKLIIGIIAFSVLMGIGTFWLIVDADTLTYYSKDAPIRQTQNLIDKHFGGSKNISIVVAGDIKDPKVMKDIDRLENKISKMDIVGNTTSIAKVVKQMSRALNDKGDKYYNKIPDSKNAIAQYFELYSMSGDPEDFDKLVDFPYKHAQITARINTGSTPKINKFVRDVKEMAKDDKNIKYIGGYTVIFAQLADLIVYGQLTSLFLAMILVAILLMILFKSITAGLISIIPLALSMGILFGMMGYLGIELSLATTMLSSIMIGVGIDYTIHYLWRYREELKGGLSHKEATKKTLLTTGRGIVFNALSVIIGFAALLISAFRPIRFFGLLVLVTIAACLIGALILIPSLSLIFKPKFLEKR